MLWFSNSIHASPARFVKLFVRPAGLLVGLLAVSAFAADTDVTRALHAVETRYNSAATLQVLFRED